MYKINRKTRFAIVTGRSMKVNKVFGSMLFYEKGNYRVGDIVCFRDSNNKKYAHRVVLIEEFDGFFYLTMKGDRCLESAPYEKRIPENRIEGKVVWSFPKI